MFNFIHRLTCKHPEVHQLNPPQSLIAMEKKGLGPWTEFSIQFKRFWNLSMEAHEERKALLASSAPTPGLKDAITGWPSLVVNPLSDWTPGPTTSEIPTPDCSKSGEDTDTDMSG